MPIDARVAAAPLSAFRWLQLAIGIACMVMIVNLQYGWMLFVLPIVARAGQRNDPGPEATGVWRMSG